MGAARRADDALAVLRRDWEAARGGVGAAESGSRRGAPGAAPGPGALRAGARAEAEGLLLSATRAAAAPFPDRDLGVTVAFSRRAARLRIRWGWPAGQGAGARGYLVSRLQEKLRGACVCYNLDFVVLEARQSWAGGAGTREESDKGVEECYVFIGGAEGECARCASLKRRAPGLVAQAVRRGLARPAASLLGAVAVETILAASALSFKRALRGGQLRGLPPAELLAALAVRRWTVCLAAAILSESKRCQKHLRERLKDEKRGIYLWGGRRVPCFPGVKECGTPRVAVRCAACQSLRPLEYMVY